VVIDIQDKKRHISAICGFCHRPRIAGSFLKGAGYENIYIVTKGMTAWMRMHQG
jgi:rhodanese-related sulfurtransferase